MAGRGPVPWSSSPRSRRHVRHLAPVVAVPAPELPDGLVDKWHPMVMSWWSDIWASPMVAEWDTTDVHGLVALAMLLHRFWTETPTSPALAAEIRLQRQCFGLTPVDRQRLRWEVDRGEEADTSTRKRRAESLGSVRLEQPAKNASKTAWVDYVVDQFHVTRAAAAAMTKAQLVACSLAPVDPRRMLSCD